jgi:hypothetical protein
MTRVPTELLIWYSFSEPLRAPTRAEKRIVDVRAARKVKRVAA